MQTLSRCDANETGVKVTNTTQTGYTKPLGEMVVVDVQSFARSLFSTRENGGS